MDLCVGTKLQIVIETEKEEQKLYLASKLEEMGKNGLFLIAAPFYKEILYPMPEGKVVTVQFFQKTAIIAFDAEVKGRTKRDGLFYLLVLQRGKMRRIQRREDFRLEVTLDGLLEYTPPNEKDKKRLRIRTSDLSGGGASVRTSKALDPGENVRSFLPMDQTMQPVFTPCVVRRCFRLDDAPADYRYCLGLQFLFENDKQKEKLIQLIFKLQRDMKKT